MTEAESRSFSVWMKPLCALRIGYAAKKTWLHSLSGLENMYIHEVSKSPVRDFWGGFYRVSDLIGVSYRGQQPHHGVPHQGLNVQKNFHYKQKTKNKQQYQVQN